MADHKRRQSARIIEATLRVIDAEGMSRVNISKVAEAASVTRQTIYNYFPDVESILLSVLDEHQAAVEQHLTALLRQSEGLLAKLRAVADFQLANAEHGHIDLEAGLSANVRARLAEHPHVVKTALQRAIKGGTKARNAPGGLSPADVSELIWGLLEGGAEAVRKNPKQRAAVLETTVKAMSAIVDHARAKKTPRKR